MENPKSCLFSPNSWNHASLRFHENSPMHISNPLHVALAVPFSNSLIKIEYSLANTKILRYSIYVWTYRLRLYFETRGKATLLWSQCEQPPFQGSWCEHEALSGGGGPDVHSSSLSCSKVTEKWRLRFNHACKGKEEPPRLSVLLSSILTGSAR